MGYVLEVFAETFVIIHAVYARDNCPSSVVLVINRDFITLLLSNYSRNAS